MASRSPDPMYRGYSREQWAQFHAEQGQAEQTNRSARTSNYPGTGYVDSGDNPQSEVGRDYQANMQARHAGSSGSGVNLEGETPSPQKEDTPMTPAEEISSEHDQTPGVASEIAAPYGSAWLAEPVFTDENGRNLSKAEILRASRILPDPNAETMISETDYDRNLLHKKGCVCLQLAVSQWEFYGGKKEYTKGKKLKNPEDDRIMGLLDTDDPSEWQFYDSATQVALIQSVSKWLTRPPKIDSHASDGNPAEPIKDTVIIADQPPRYKQCLELNWGLMVQSTNWMKANKYEQETRRAMRITYVSDPGIQYELLRKRKFPIPPELEYFEHAREADRDTRLVSPDGYSQRPKARPRPPPAAQPTVEVIDPVESEPAQGYPEVTEILEESGPSKVVKVTQLFQPDDKGPNRDRCIHCKMLFPDHPGGECPQFWKNNSMFRIREISDTAGSSNDPIPQSESKCRKSQAGTSPGAAMVAAASVNIRDTGVAVSEEGNDMEVSVKYTQLMPRFEFVAKVSPGWFHMNAFERDEHMRVKNPELWAVFRQVIQQSNRLDEIRANRAKYAAHIPSLRDQDDPDEANEALVAPTKIEVVLLPAGPLEPELLNDGFTPPEVQTIANNVDEAMPPPPPPRADSSIMANGEGDDIDASWEMAPRVEEEDIDMASSIATVASVSLPASAESASAVSGDVPRTADSVDGGNSLP